MREGYYVRTRTILLIVALLFVSRLAHERLSMVNVKADVGLTVHNLNTGLNYTTIQEAINAPETHDGHTMLVDEGTYHENVIVNKSNLTLVGENKETTVIDGNGTTTLILDANDTEVREFTLQNGYFGIRMSPWTHGHVITNNIITNNIHGISGHYDCINMSIYDNTISLNNATGIQMLFSNSVVCNNLIADNGRGEFKQFGSGIQIVMGTNSEVVYCVNNSVCGNTIKNHQTGILATRYSTDNLFLHNNLINNTAQLLASATNWNNSLTENYWSDYNGTDANDDGIGDVYHEIDENIQDNYPLMGMFSSFKTSTGESVTVVSNSTIENFEYSESNRTIRMRVSNMTANQAYGFCRMCIPHALTNVTHISVIIDNGLTPILYHNYTLLDNGTHRWIYFSYPHSTREIIIIPEYPSVITAISLIVASLAFAVYKKKRLESHLKRNQTKLQFAFAGLTHPKSANYYES